MNSIEQRLSGLESQLCRWKAICLVLLFCIAGRWLLAAEEKKEPQEVVARSLTLVDASGKDAGFSVHPGKVGAIVTIGSGEYGRIEMYPDVDGGLIRIIGKEDHMRAQLVGSERGGGLDYTMPRTTWS
jgi:hypothetical protein